MSKKSLLALTTLAMLAATPALAWIDPGVNETHTPPRPQVLSFDQQLEREMRDLRRMFVLEQAARAAQESTALSLEQEMRDLRASFLAKPRSGEGVVRFGQAFESLCDEVPA